MDIVERLKKMAGKGDYYDDEYRAAIVEIERLREALREIHGLGDTPDDSWKAYQICCRALGEKE